MNLDYSYFYPSRITYPSFPLFPYAFTEMALLHAAALAQFAEAQEAFLADPKNQNNLRDSYSFSYMRAVDEKGNETITVSDSDHKDEIKQTLQLKEKTLNYTGPASYFEKKIQPELQKALESAPVEVPATEKEPEEATFEDALEEQVAVEKQETAVENPGEVADEDPTVETAILKEVKAEPASEETSPNSIYDRMKFVAEALRP